MQIQDFGKIAATFVDTETGRAVRIWPHPQARQAAAEYQRCGLDRWHAYLEAYKELPAAGLLKFQEVTLNVSMQAIISRNAARAVCARCGEEIFNEREVFQDGQILCRGCAGQSYFSIDPHAP
jgi:formylmethanofuran dehydrogenase subunit E